MDSRMGTHPGHNLAAPPLQFQCSLYSMSNECTLWFQQKSVFDFCLVFLDTRTTTLANSGVRIDGDATTAGFTATWPLHLCQIVVSIEEKKERTNCRADGRV